MYDTLTSIRERRTIKVLSDAPLPTVPVEHEFIEQLLEAAYWAPFHHPCHRDLKSNLASDLPFRFYVIDSASCRQIAQRLVDENIDAGKLIGMLNSADYLIQATWLPQPSDCDGLFEPSIANMEHIAAASSAIQNMLLTATALGRENYWGSGGVLRQEFAYRWLNMPVAEILLGSLFIFPSPDSLAEGVIHKTSPKRTKRGALSDCYRWVKL